MWFQNLRLYRLSENISLSADELGEALSEHSFQPCGKLDPLRYGWVSPLGRHGSEYIHQANGYTMLCAKRQEKILPAAAIKELLEDRIAQISADENRHVGRKERDTLKDEIIFSLMPRALSKSSLDFGYLAPKTKMIVVNSASAKRAEDFLNALREAIGTLKVVPLAPVNAPSQTMTRWVQSGNIQNGFELGEECELKAAKDGRIIHFKNQDLGAQEVLGHLDSGMFVSKVAVNWNNAIHSIIDEHFAIKRLKFEDAIREKAGERQPETAAEEFDTEFAIMTMELEAFILGLITHLGGIQSVD